MISIEGQTLDPLTRERLSHPAVGGVILFARNYVSPTQLADLTRDIRSAKSSPLLIAVDQEGGRVQRFTDSFTRLPALRLIGDLYEPLALSSQASSSQSGLILVSPLFWIWPALTKPLAKGRSIKIPILSGCWARSLPWA